MNVNNLVLYELSLNDIYSKISTTTDKAQYDRSKILGDEFKLTNIIDVELSPPNIIFTWFVKPTFSKQVNVVNPHSHKFNTDKSEQYEIKISILDFYKLKGKKKLKQLTVQDITKIIKKSDVKIWNSSPAFHFQGFNFKLSQLGASLYPTNIPDKNWRTKHKDALVDKHLYLLIKNIQKWIPQMAMALKSEIKKLEG